jgi:hypothetical protein
LHWVADGSKVRISFCLFINFQLLWCALRLCVLAELNLEFVVLDLHLHGLVLEDDKLAHDSDHVGGREAQLALLTLNNCVNFSLLLRGECTKDALTLIAKRLAFLGLDLGVFDLRHVSLNHVESLLDDAEEISVLAALVLVDFVVFLPGIFAFLLGLVVVLHASPVQRLDDILLLIEVLDVILNLVLTTHVGYIRASQGKVYLSGRCKDRIGRLHELVVHSC